MHRTVPADSERCEARVSLDMNGSREDGQDRGANEGRCRRRKGAGASMFCHQHAQKQLIETRAAVRALLKDIEVDSSSERRRADDERWTEEERAEWQATGQYDTTEERDDDRA